MPALLRGPLLEHTLTLGRDRGLVFGRTADVPFTPDVPQRRADRAWKAANTQEVETAEREGREPRLLERIILDEARHYASLLIAAGVDASPCRAAQSSGLSGFIRIAPETCCPPGTELRPAQPDSTEPMSHLGPWGRAIPR
jgi:hypothetical protein